MESVLCTMAYQFFSKAHQSKNKPLNTAPPAQTSYKGRHNQPPIHPQRPVPPASSASSASSGTLASSGVPSNPRETAVQPAPYPHAMIATCPTPHPRIAIESVSTAHIPSLTRITGLLLPIRYPNSFYTAIITDPVVASLSRVAIYRDHPAPCPALPTSSAPNANPTSTDKVIGGIRCRLDRLPQITAELLRNSQSQDSESPASGPTNLYIQTLHLLSPYRGNGVAAALLNSLLFSETPKHEDATSKPAQVSGLVRHYNIRTVSAHVHEANEDALKWYIARGFQVEDAVVENYYRRLKPSGARIVKLFLQWTGDEKADPQVPVNGKEDERTDDKAEEVEQQGSYDGDDEDWEKVEAEDEDEQEDHGVQPLMDSKVLDLDEGGSRKRKADDDLQQR